MKNRKTNNRNGFTLLELTAATAMLSALTVSCMVLVSTSFKAWNRHEEDQSSRQVGLAVLRHITRHTRQAQSVSAISAMANPSGSLSLVAADGQLYVWEHDAGSKEVRFGIDTATEILATDIEELTFLGIKRNGWETTTMTGQIHSLRCTVKVGVSRPTSTEIVTSSCQAWLRAW